MEREKICKELKVLKRIQETRDAVSLILEIPRTSGGQFNYKAGQFVTFFMDINGEEVRRSYSLASSPETDTEFKIAVKLVPGGKGSTYLINNIKEGSKLWVTPPAGHFCLPQEIRGQNFSFFAAGSGITPIISLCKTALKMGAKKCILFFQNRSEEEIIYKNEIETLTVQYKAQFIVQHVLSQPSAHWSGIKGRATPSHVSEFINANFKNDEDITHFICGPSGFIETIEATLKNMSFSAECIKKESFSVASAPATAKQDSFELDEDSVLIGDRGQVGVPQEIEAIIEGTTYKVPYKKDKTVLECLLEAELNPPYSCLDGACMACIAKVQTGLVFQNDMGILTDDNVDAGECLTCQARPASPIVKVNFETF